MTKLLFGYMKGATIAIGGKILQYLGYILHKWSLPIMGVRWRER